MDEELITSAYLEPRQLSSGPRFVLYRARRARDNAAVVIKLVRSGEPDGRNAGLLRHEYDLLSTLDIAGVARPCAFERLGDRDALVLEDAGARDLKESLQAGPMTTGRFLELAIRMTSVVAAVHARGVIHRDICPDNFVLGPAGPTLVDFELATMVPAFTQLSSQVGELEGTLSYLAPEQTGWTRRAVDQRADLYALGATFYEMLAGSPPFTSPNVLELVHAHVARTPVAPAIVNASVPRVISDVIGRLLAKLPEWRYQTADALRTDLEEASRQWASRGEIAPFELGRQDAPARLLLDDRLYERERELSALDQALARVADGAREMVLIAGGAGSGKTALVREARRATESRVRWAACKVGMVHGDVPYRPVLEALGSMVSDLLREPADTTAALGQRIRDALGANAGVLTELIPELTQLIGSQPPPAPVGAAEAETRLHMVFAAFVRVVATQANPLVLFVDDLQWIDPASIALLQALASDRELQFVMLLAACRTEEISARPDVAQLLTAIRDAGITCTRIDIERLGTSAVHALLCDALHVDADRAAPLARIIEQKTAGNPFAVRRLLGFLYRTGRLSYDPANGTWEWDLAAIATTEVSDNVVDLLSAMIATLPAATQTVLEVAACAGKHVALGLLASVRGEPLETIARALATPIREGLLVPATEGVEIMLDLERPVELRAGIAPSYRFAHDRIQQAIYGRLSAEQRTALHLRIGRELLRALSPAALEDHVCEVTDQLNLAVDRIADSERHWLAELDHRAGRRARSAAAYRSALAYFEKGLEIVPPTEHALWFRLTRDAAECATLAGAHDVAERLVDEGLVRARTALEKADLGAIAVMLNSVRGMHAEAISRGLEGLRVLGAAVPDHDLDPALETARRRLREALANRAPADLLNAPLVDVPEERARIQLLSMLAPPTWFADPKLYRLLAYRAATSTIENGNAPESAFVYASCALALVMDGAYEEAGAFGELAIRLAERSVDPALACRVLMVVGGHVSPWREPLRRSLPILRRAHALGVESGELQHAAYALAHILFALYFTGARLDQLVLEADAILAFEHKIGHRYGSAYILPLRQFARCLKGVTRAPPGLDDAEFDEARFLADAKDNGVAMALHHIVHLETAYHLGDLDHALEWSVAAAPRIADLRDLFLQVEHSFFSALVLAALCSTSSSSERWAALRDHERRLATWARIEPANFESKHDIVAAEIARLEDRHADAVTLYHRAIEMAGREGFVQDGALAHELCGRWHLGRGERQMAEVHLATALDGYARWGATAKIRFLLNTLPPLEGLAERTRMMHSPRVTAPPLDYLSLLEAAEALASELVLERLIEKMARICLQAAGAQRAVIILDEGGLVVRATSNAAGEAALERTPLVATSSLPAELIERVHQRGDLVALSDVLARTGEPPHRLRSVVVVPLRRGDRALGALYAESDTLPGGFAPERVEMLRQLAAQMAIALENSRLFDERRRAEAALRLIADASKALAESLDCTATLWAVARLIVKTHGDMCVIDLLDGGTLRAAAWAHANPARSHLIAELRERFPLTSGSSQPAAVALRSRQVVMVPTATDDDLRASCLDAEHLRLIHGLQPRSIIAVPLIARGRVLGALSLAASVPGRYGPMDAATVMELGNRIAAAVDNSRLYSEAQAAVRARDEFLSVASHELRTPLTSLSLSAEVMRRSPSAIPKSLELLERQVGRLTRLVDEMLTVGRIQLGKIEIERQDVDLVALAREVAERFAVDAARARSPIEVRATGPVVGRWDRAKLDQVISNLMSNAVKFGAAKPIEITVEALGTTARLAITDHGIGIPAERLPAIFERFERAVSSRTYGGLGLGLYIVRTLVEAHDGTVQATSAGLGKGTRVTIELPL